MQRKTFPLRIWGMAAAFLFSIFFTGCSDRPSSPEEIAAKYRHLPSQIALFLALSDLAAQEPEEASSELKVIIEKIEPLPDPIRPPDDWGSITVTGEASPAEVEFLRRVYYFLSKSLTGSDERNALMPSLHFRIGTEEDEKMADHESPFTAGTYLMAWDPPTKTVVVNRNPLPYHHFMDLVGVLGHELYHAVHHNNISTRSRFYRSEAEAIESEIRTAPLIQKALDGLAPDAELHEGWDFEQLRAFWHVSFNLHLAVSMASLCEFQIRAGIQAVGQLWRYEPWERLVIHGADDAYNTEAKRMVMTASAMTSARDLSREDLTQISALLKWFLALCKQRAEVRKLLEQKGGTLADLEYGIAACDTVPSRRDEVTQARKKYSGLLEDLRQRLRAKHSR